MNSKFVKENKVVLKEFIGALIGAVVTGALSRDVKKKIANDPAFQKRGEEIKKLSKDLAKKLEKYKKTDPEFYNSLKKQVSYF